LGNVILKGNLVKGFLDGGSMDERFSLISLFPLVLTLRLDFRKVSPEFVLVFHNRQE